jgi:hypothetical protein
MSAGRGRIEQDGEIAQFGQVGFSLPYVQEKSKKTELPLDVGPVRSIFSQTQYMQTVYTI